MGFILAFRTSLGSTDVEYPCTMARMGRFLKSLSGKGIGLLLMLLMLPSKVLSYCDVEPDSDGKVVLPSSWTSVPPFAFADCYTLKEINFTDSPHIVDIKRFAFANAVALTNVYFGNSITSIGKSAFRACVGLKTLHIPSSVTEIHDHAFQNAKYLNSVSFSEGLLFIGEGAFQHCDFLLMTKFSLPESLLYIGLRAFDSTPITSGPLIIPPRVTFIGYKAFVDTQFSSVVIPDSVVKVNESAFAGNEEMKTMSIGKSLKTILYRFAYECSALENVSFAEDSVLEEIGEVAFAYTKLKGVVLPRGLRIVGSEAFSNTQLETMEFPDSVVAIKTRAFTAVPSLTKVRFGRSLRSIEEKAFSETRLENISIPESCDYIGDQAFGQVATLRAVQINSSKIAFGVAVFGDAQGALETAQILYNKSIVVTEGLSLAGDLVALECDDEECVCKAGYGSLEAAESPYFNCVACPEGKTSDPGRTRNNQRCIDCGVGTYADERGLAACKLCPRGRYSESSSNATTVDVCLPCNQGTYAATQGREECLQCPPGAYCPDKELSAYLLCSVGHISQFGGSTVCAPCPPGEFQNMTGQALCFSCPPGTYAPNPGAINDTFCIACEPGKYSGSPGLECISCPEGQYQPSEGTTSCASCASRNKLYTSTSDHLDCELNRSFLSESLIETIFSDGIAIGLTFAIAAVFVIAGITIHREKIKDEHKDKLGQLDLTNVLVKTVLPGFSFGAEFFLILGLLTDCPPYGAAMLFFRLLHFVFCLGFTVALFSPSDKAANSLSFFFQDIHQLRNDIDTEFCMTRIPHVAVTLLMASCDVTVLQFLPWKASTFYTKSRGYPTLQLMKVSIGTEVITSVVSVICQLSYLLSKGGSIDNPTHSTEAKALFVLNIMNAVAAVVLGVLFLFLRTNLLHKQHAQQEQEQEQANTSGTDAMEIELGDIYLENQRDGDDVIPSASVQNPLRKEESQVAPQQDGSTAMHV